MGLHTFIGQYQQIVANYKNLQQKYVFFMVIRNRLSESKLTKKACP